MAEQAKFVSLEQQIRDAMKNGTNVEIVLSDSLNGKDRGELEVLLYKTYDEEQKQDRIHVTDTEDENAKDGEKCKILWLPWIQNMSYCGLNAWQMLTHAPPETLFFTTPLTGYNT